MRTRKVLYDVGVSDANYLTQIRRRNVEGIVVLEWLCPYYDRWAGILRRCYSPSFLEKRPSYRGCSVCDEWLTFSNFKKWMETQNWKGNDLDKDLMVEDNKIYSPDTCAFITREINSFFALRGNDRRLYPVGVTCRNMKYTARISHPNGVRMDLGRFKTPEEAHQAWKAAKRDRAVILQSEQIDSRVITGLQRVIDKLSDAIENNTEIKSL